MKGFPDSSAGKESTCNAGDLGLIPGLGRSPEEENGNPLQYSCLENPMDGGAWLATVHGVAKSRTRLTESESEVAQLCPTLCDPMDCSPPGSSVHGIFQARILEWGATELLYSYRKIICRTVCQRYSWKRIVRRVMKT